MIDTEKAISEIKIQTDALPKNLKLRWAVQRPLYKVAWVPSQKGMVLECLHAHHATVVGSVI